MTDVRDRPDEVRLEIDGQQLSVPNQTLVIRAAERLGITIPRFCDHPLLDPVAACRQCLVEIEGQRKPFTSCSTVCTDGMVVKTHLTSDVARRGQEGQLELLLINHPLDCPQCDKGGECPLQDQALAHGPPDSRFIDAKRRFVKPVPISAQVALDRERCVLCARCTRFSQEISGDPFIELFERGALEQVAIYEDEPYDSYFSGNVVQICPVGALTAASYRFRARPFDLRSHDGVCNQCSAGCNLRVDVRGGEIQRQLAGENAAVNELWNCDKGRFGFEFVGHPERLRSPVVRNQLSSLVPTGWQAALTRAAEGLKAALDDGGPGAVGVMTGGRLTDEDAYAASRFARQVLGTDNVDFRLRPRSDQERDVLAAVSGTVGPTYDEVEAADVVVVAGLDAQEEVPILFLRLRKAWRKHRQRIILVGPVLGSFAEIAWRWVPTAAGEEATILSALSGDGPTALDGVADVAEVLRGAQRPGGAGAPPKVVVLAGERLAQSPGALLAAARLAAASGGAFAWVARRNGARGAVDAGLLPGVLPGGRTLAEPGDVATAWAAVPDEPGLDARGMLEAAARGELTALYLIGVDPARDFEDPVLARAALSKVSTLIVQDLLPTETTRYADVILPAAAPQERVGSFTTWEGRRQPFPQAVSAQPGVLADWDIIRQLARALGTDLGWETAMDVRVEAAPLMESPRPARESLADLPVPVAADHVHERQERDSDGDFDVVVLDWLLGQGDMLVGAKALKETARPAAVWINEVDAGRLGFSDGATVAVVSDTGRVDLPALLTRGVVAGCVVVPGSSSYPEGNPLGGDGAGGLRVRLESGEG